MGILILLVPLALILAASGVAAYAWAWRNGQFEDLDTHVQKPFWDEDKERKDDE